jgi:hypothetical protein
MSDITAKVLCTTKLEQHGHDGATFEFGPNYNDPSGKNAEWAQYTPTFYLKLSVKEGSMFKVGQAYTLTFREDVNAAQTSDPVA